MRHGFNYKIATLARYSENAGAKFTLETRAEGGSVSYTVVSSTNSKSDSSDGFKTSLRLTMGIALSVKCIVVRLSYTTSGISQPQYIYPLLRWEGGRNGEGIRVLAVPPKTGLNSVSQK
jgi:hypothetical protein